MTQPSWGLERPWPLKALSAKTITATAAFAAMGIAPPEDRRYRRRSRVQAAPAYAAGLSYRTEKPESTRGVRLGPENTRQAGEQATTRN